MTDIDQYAVRLLSRTTIAQDTVAFEIERPENFAFEAGQFVSIQLLDFEAPSDGSDDGERMLSIASAPHDQNLTVAVRMRDSAFKKHLAAAPIGAEGLSLGLSPAMGDFVLPEGELQPVVMVAGGIGITPFYSMLRDLQQRVANGQAVPAVTLLYGNRSLELAAWRDELNALVSSVPSLRVVHVISEETVANPVARSGFIDAQLIQDEVQDWMGSRYFIAGPTAMVAALQDCLDTCGVPPEQVTIEFFAGY